MAADFLFSVDLITGVQVCLLFSILHKLLSPELHIIPKQSMAFPQPSNLQGSTQHEGAGRKKKKRKEEKKERGGLFGSLFMECEKGFRNPQINPDLLVTELEVRGA